jgi:hypothetical protein
MDVKVNGLLFEFVEQIGGDSREINPQSLHAIVKVSVDNFSYCRPTRIIKIDRINPSRIHIIQKSAITHPADSSVFRGSQRTGG